MKLIKINDELCSLNIVVYDGGIFILDLQNKKKIRINYYDDLQEELNIYFNQEIVNRLYAKLAS